MHTPAPLPVRVLTHNIRYAKTPPLFEGEAPWGDRAPLLAAELLVHAAHHPAPLICLQEALRGQLADTVAALDAASDSPWAHAGVGRDDGRAAGEFSAVLYQPATWEALAVATRWLSHTPLQPGSKFPGAGSPRILTAARMRHRATGAEVLALATHLDDQSAAARAFAAARILEHAAHFSLVRPGPEAAAAGGRPYRLPVVLAGDLNSRPDEQAYLTLTDPAAADRVFTDAWAAPSRYSWGDADTFTGFDGDTSKRKRIDFVLAMPVAADDDDGTAAADSRGRWEVEGAAVVPNVFDAGVYVSDHRAVVADLLLRRD